MKRIAGFFSVALIASISTVLLFSYTTKNDDFHAAAANEEASETGVNQTIEMTSGQPPLIQGLPDFSEAADLSVHAVVHIKTEYYTQSRNIYDYFFDWRDFFGETPNTPDRRQRVSGSGSGVIISSSGYIVTNNHVVENADNIEVTLNDKRTYVAQIIGTDPSTDLALIKIDIDGLPYMTYGNSDELKIGEWVLAVGNPFNLTSTVTAGIVSAKARNINILSSPDGTSAIESFIQTDAAVNRGNSGGALVNTRGELVGINAAIASSTGYYAGYSFAIPVNIVKKVVADLREFGEVQRALIGVSIRDIDSEFAEDLGLDMINGVYVAGLSENGSAKEVGIEVGDVITSVDGRKINSTSELLETVGQHRPGDRIKVLVKRDKKFEEYTVTLKNREGTTDIVSKEDEQAIALLGASLEVPTKDDLARLGLDYGLQVTGMEQGKLRSAGIREGFIITQINKKPVRKTADIERELKDASGGVLIEGIYPSGIKAYYAIGL